MFNAEKTTNEIIKFIRDYYEKNNIKKAVIGISGGKDSGVVAALFTKALGKENVTGIWMPCHSKEEDKTNARKLADHFGFRLLEFDLTNVYDLYVDQIKDSDLDIDDNDLVDANINIKPRLRTSTLYYYAAMLSHKEHATYIVPGTSNACELYVGYFTKGGDSVSDILTIADLTVDEVIQVGEYLGVIDEVVHKAPDDGLSGMTDEEKLGVKYSDIAKVMNGEEVEAKEKEKIMRLHKANQHKFVTPTFRK